MARIPRLIRAVEAVVSLFLARLLKHFLALPSGFFFLSRSRATQRVFSFSLALLNLLILPKLSILLNLANPPHNVCFCPEKGAQLRTSRTSAHIPFVRVFVCLCA